MDINSVEEFKKIADESDESLCLSDGVEIVYANKCWLDSYKYTASDIEGRTFKILQGPQSDLGVIKKLMEATELRQQFQGTLTNYSSEGIVVKDTVTIIPVLESHFVVKSSVVPIE